MYQMSIFKVIIFLLVVLTIAVDSRALRKRRQDPKSSAYYSNNGMNIYPYINYALALAGLGNNLVPIGNNWYAQGPPNPYNYPLGYNMQQPYMSYYSYPTSYNTYSSGQYGTLGYNNQISSNAQAYMGQSYIPSSEWLPLPGRDRRRQIRRKRHTF